MINRVILLNFVLRTLFRQFSKNGLNSIIINSDYFGSTRVFRKIRGIFYNAIFILLEKSMILMFSFCSTSWLLLVKSRWMLQKYNATHMINYQRSNEYCVILLRGRFILI